MVFTFELILIIGFTTVIFFYFLSVCILTIKLNKTERGAISKSDIYVNVVIAFRNEEAKIAALIDSLIKQSYHNCKFVLVDDHSTDNGLSVAFSKTKNEQRFQIFQLPANLAGKKDALEFGTKQCKGEFILFTDADCTINPNWVETMVNEMTHNNLEFCSGALLIHDCKNILQKLQAVETLFLTAVGHSLISCKKPVLCNGANIAIKRETNDTTLLNHVSSGDDIFRLQQAVKAKKRVGYTTVKETQVFSKAESTLLEMVQQKVRWIGKSKHYIETFSLIFTAFIGLSQVVAAVSIFILPVKIWITLLATKILSETILTVKAMSVYDHKVSPFNIFAVGILYPFYSVAIAIISLFYKPQWKGRKVKG